VERIDPDDREFVRALDRGLAVLRAFGADRPTLTMSQVAARTGLTRAVARRHLFTLESLGYLAHDDGRFALTPRVLDLGFTYLSSLSVAEAAQPFMVQVAEKLRESCSLAVLDGQDVVYVGRVVADRIMTTNIVIGTRLPAHATSMGKVLLAHLPPERLDLFLNGGPLKAMTERTICNPVELRAILKDVRQRGFSTNDEESEKGVRTVAVPIVDRSGKIVAAMNVAGHAWRVSMRELKRDHLPVLLEAAQGLSRALGSTVTPHAASSG
jgi:IclR family pca regulon transcriptional regulator